MDSLPNDVIDTINQKKFNLELLEHMKSFDTLWGKRNLDHYHTIRRWETFLVGDKIVYAREYHYIEKVCEKSVVLDDGRRAKIDSIVHARDYYIPERERFEIDNHILDTGSVWCHPLALKYDIPKCRRAVNILSHNLVVSCDDPLAWLCLLVLNPNIEIKRTTDS